MNLVPINTDSVPIGRPLPFALLDKDGVLLAKKQFVVESRSDLMEFASRGGGLYINTADSEAHHRAYMDQLYGLIREDKSIGQIAGATIPGELLADRVDKTETRLDWLDLQEQGNALLRESHPSTFLERLDKLYAQLSKQIAQNPDGALFALIQLSSGEPRMYSATHSMLVSVMCALAAKEVLNWPPAIEALVCKAALTMNIGMTELQDTLAWQVESPTADQHKHIDAHALQSVSFLKASGVTDAIWLDAIRWHHTQTPGPLREKTPAQRISRLIQRADIFAARLSPRATRPATGNATAMQACYFDELKQVDEAGAAIVKAVGIYQPGSFVRLTNGEIAIVIKRGLNTSTPRVAVVINRSGLPVVEPISRETSLRDYRIVSPVSRKDVKVQINLEKFLPLTAVPTSNRPW